MSNEQLCAPATSSGQQGRQLGYGLTNSRGFLKDDSGRVLRFGDVTSALRWLCSRPGIINQGYRPAELDPDCPLFIATGGQPTRYVDTK